MRSQGGKITGKITKILDPRNSKNFKKGDILVTTMTSPDFVTLMKKAAAIVTDEGGITCHAAVISRELGIPCVIGTRIATDVLDNGDLVEVNANHGIIKILEKN
jgi:pyruvate,water dikinase